MKKVISCFLLAQFGFLSHAWAIAGAEIPASKFVDLATKATFSDDGGYAFMKDNKCAYENLPGNDRRSNEYLYLSNTNSGKGYEADNSRCGNNIQVCVSGYSTVSTKTSHNQCWTADVPRIGGDSWKPKISIPECTPTSSSPWTGQSSEKTPVFVNKRQKIMMQSTNIIKTIVGTNPTNDYDLDCIAYICDNGDNKFSYGCQDGSCTDGCPNDTTVDPTPNPDPTPSPTDPNVTNRNSAKPYLDAIDNQCP